jgi:hypothetical protein
MTVVPHSKYTSLCFRSQALTLSGRRALLLSRLAQHYRRQSGNRPSALRRNRHQGRPAHTIRVKHDSAGALELHPTGDRLPRQRIMPYHARRTSPCRSEARTRPPGNPSPAGPSLNQCGESPPAPLASTPASTGTHRTRTDKPASKPEARDDEGIPAPRRRLRHGIDIVPPFAWPIETAGASCTTGHRTKVPYPFARSYDKLC